MTLTAPDVHGYIERTPDRLRAWELIEASNPPESGIVRHAQRETAADRARRTREKETA